MAWGYQQFGVSSTATAGDPTLGRLVHLSVFASGKGGCYFLPGLMGGISGGKCT